nr:hypothetical protein [Tanacetum cinerariifolium]GEZ12209.1 hypothetical protein [Tanacetum cinerariifolium]
MQPVRGCSYTDFMKCQPLNFKGTEGNVGLSRWVEKMESVFHISGCAVENQVKFATCTMLDAALTWWNGHVRTLGHDNAYAMTWETFKKRLTDKYCPKELTLMCTKFLFDETEKVDKYISGLPDNIHGNVMSVRPKTLDFVIELANDLMDQKLRTYAERQAENKRKLDNNNKDQQQLLKKQNVVQAYAIGSGKKKPYEGSKPLCPKCNYHRDGECAPKCTNCKKVSHLTKDCWHPINANNQRTITCYECRNQGHYRIDYPVLKNQVMFSPSTVTYTSVYIISKLWRLRLACNEELKEPMEDQPLPADASPTALSPDYVVDSDPEKDEKDPKEDPADYPANKRDNDDDELSNDDNDDD